MRPIDYDSIADIYDLYVVADFDLPFFRSEVLEVGGEVLELMAGTGRLTVPLLEAGARLTAVDISRGMLDVLSSKLRGKNLRAEIVCSDVRELNLGEKFDLAFLPFNSLSEILLPEDRWAALRAIHASLRPGGRFVCTLHNPRVRRATVDGALRLTGRFPTQDGLLVVSGMEREENRVVERLQFFDFYDREGNFRSRRLLEMRFAMIERGELEGMLEEVGFSTISFFGDYQRDGFRPDRSSSMIWVLKKQPIRAYP
ncbi:MAG: class I SAM-dependent methyltransferase [Bacteroidota bacterium]